MTMVTTKAKTRTTTESTMTTTMTMTTATATAATMTTTPTRHTTTTTTTSTDSKVDSTPRLSSNTNGASWFFQGESNAEINILCTAAAIVEAGESAVQVKAVDQTVSATCVAQYELERQYHDAFAHHLTCANANLVPCLFRDLNAAATATTTSTPTPNDPVDGKHVVVSTIVLILHANLSTTAEKYTCQPEYRNHGVYSYHALAECLDRKCIFTRNTVLVVEDNVVTRHKQYRHERLI